MDSKSLPRRKKQFTGVSPAGSNPDARNGGCNYKRGCVAAMRPFVNLLWTLVVLRCRFCRRDWSAYRSEVPARWTIPEPPVAIRLSALFSLIHWIHPFTEAISPPCFHSLNSQNFHPFLSISNFVGWLYGYNLFHNLNYCRSHCGRSNKL